MPQSLHTEREVLHYWNNGNKYLISFILVIQGPFSIQYGSTSSLEAAVRHKAPRTSEIIARYTQNFRPRYYCLVRKQTTMQQQQVRSCAESRQPFARVHSLRREIACWV